MFTKKVEKDFIDKLWGGEIKLSVTIKKLSQMDMDRDVKESMKILKSVDKKDRATFFKASQTGDIGGILTNINDPESLTKLFRNTSDNIRKCIHDMSYIEIQGDSQIDELSGHDNIDKIFSKLGTDHIAWIAEICKKFNPELFGDKGAEEKKN